MRISLMALAMFNTAFAVLNFYFGLMPDNQIALLNWVCGAMSAVCVPINLIQLSQIE